MARWRDVKQGKVPNDTNTKNKQQTIHNDSLCNASLLNRFKAFVTDTFMVTMPIMYIVFYLVLGSREEFAAHMILGWIYILIPQYIIIGSFLYFKGQTPGLKAYELSLIDNITGTKPNIFAITNRYIFTTLSILFIIPLFVPYFRKDKKTLQDIVSNTCITITPNHKP